MITSPRPQQDNKFRLKKMLQKSVMKQGKCVPGSRRLGKSVVQAAHIERGITATSIAAAAAAAGAATAGRSPGLRTW